MPFQSALLAEYYGPFIQCRLYKIPEDTDCSICRSKVEKNIDKLACGHYFHKECIHTWFQKKLECPNCRFVTENKIQPEPRPNPTVNAEPSNRNWLSRGVIYNISPGVTTATVGETRNAVPEPVNTFRIIDPLQTENLRDSYDLDNDQGEFIPDRLD